MEERLVIEITGNEMQLLKNMMHTVYDYLNGEIDNGELHEQIDYNIRTWIDGYDKKTPGSLKSYTTKVQ